MTSSDFNPRHSHTVVREVDLEEGTVKGRFYTPSGLASYFKKSISTIQVWIKQGILPDAPFRDSDGTRLYPIEYGQKIRRELFLNGKLSRRGRNVGTPRRAHTRVIQYGRGKPVEERLYTVSALAALLGVHRKTVINMEKRGGLPESPFVVGNRRVYTSEMMGVVENFYHEGPKNRQRDVEWKTLHDNIMAGWQDLKIHKAKIVGEKKMKAKAKKVEETTLEDERNKVLAELKGEDEESSPQPSYLEPVMIYTNRTYKSSGELVDQQEEAEKIAVRDFLVPPARVGVELTQTVNMGNYESIRISVSMHAPCYAEELEDAYEHLVSRVKERIVVERDEAAEWAKKTRGAKNVF